MRPPEVAGQAGNDVKVAIRHRGRAARSLFAGDSLTRSSCAHFGVSFLRRAVSLARLLGFPSAKREKYAWWGRGERCCWICSIWSFGRWDAGMLLLMVLRQHEWVGDIYSLKNSKVLNFLWKMVHYIFKERFSYHLFTTTWNKEKIWYKNNQRLKRGIFLFFSFITMSKSFSSADQRDSFLLAFTTLFSPEDHGRNSKQQMTAPTRTAGVGACILKLQVMKEKHTYSYP